MKVPKLLPVVNGGKVPSTSDSVSGGEQRGESKPVMAVGSQEVECLEGSKKQGGDPRTPESNRQGRYRSSLQPNRQARDPSNLESSRSKHP